LDRAARPAPSSLSFIAPLHPLFEVCQSKRPTTKPRIATTHHPQWRNTVMQYRTLGRTGVQVSSLALGAMNFGKI